MHGKAKPAVNFACGVATQAVANDAEWWPIQACCLDFLYFNRQLLEAGLRDLADHPEEARVLPLLLAGFSDGHHLLSHTCLDVDATHKVRGRKYPQLTLPRKVDIRIILHTYPSMYSMQISYALDRVYQEAAPHHDCIL